MSLADRIKQRRIELNMSQDELARKIGYKSRSTVNKIELGVNDITQSKIVAFAKALNTTPAYLMGWEDEEKEHQIGKIYGANEIYPIPVFESVSAGFGAYADSCVLEYMPLPFDSEYEAKQSMCIIVHGDSMYPKIEDGDKIVVRKQSSVDSGSIAVVIVDGDDGLVKKVEYDDNSIDLISINPEYKTKHFEGADVLRINVVGLVKQIVKTL